MTLVRKANTGELAKALVNAASDLPVEHRLRFSGLLSQLLVAMLEEKERKSPDYVFVGVAHAVEEYPMSAKLRLEWERPKSDEYNWHKMRLPPEEE